MCPPTVEIKFFPEYKSRLNNFTYFTLGQYNNVQSKDQLFKQGPSNWTRLPKKTLEKQKTGEINLLFVCFGKLTVSLPRDEAL